jgi:N-acetylneuraminic acid mutarotase
MIEIGRRIDHGASLLASPTRALEPAPMIPERLLPALALCLLLPTLASGQATVYSSGCASVAPIPTIGHSGTIAPFQQQTIHMGGMPPSSLIYCVLGISNTDGNGDPIEINLSNVPDVIATGCTLNTSIEVELFFTADGNGNFDFSFPLKPSFGTDINFQFAFYESFAPNSIAVSPALNLHHPLTATPDQDPVECDTAFVGDGAPAETLVLSNDAFTNITIDALTIFDGEASDFMVVPTTPLPVLLQPGQSLDVDVFFSPTGAGLRSTKLQVGHKWLPGAWTEPVVELKGIGLEEPGKELLIDVGSDSLYIDGQGDFWVPGFGVTHITLGSTADPISGTTEEALYQTYVEGPSVSYALPLPNAKYVVSMHFLEPEHQAGGLRVMDVSLEGALLFDDLDVHALVGHDTAYKRSPTVEVTDGMLDIDIVGVVDQGILAALEIRSIFPVLDITPASHDFGYLGQGQSDFIGLTLTNNGTDDLELASLKFHTHTGAGADFELDLDGNQYVGGPDLGAHSELNVPATLSLPMGQSIPATLTFSPLAHSSYDLQLHFQGNFEETIVSAVGNGGSAGHPFLHVVIEPLAETVDWDGNGTEPVFLDGSFSHTHEPGKNLVNWTWEEGQTTLSILEQDTIPFALGEHTVCLTIGDDNLPQEELTDCITFEVSPVTAIPGVLGQYYDSGATPPSLMLDATLMDPDWSEALDLMRVEEGGSGYGGSALGGNAVLRVRADVDVDSAGSYEFALAGGHDDRLLIDGSPYLGALSLSVGTHAVEARFAVANVTELPVEVLFGPAGGTLDPIAADVLTHDASVDPPVINSMTAEGSTLGGNTIVIEGFGFFPEDQVTVHWDSQDLTELDFISWSSTQIVLLSPSHAAGAIPVTVETPNGTSPAATFTYLTGGPPPISFTLENVATTTRPIAGTWAPDGKFYVVRRFGQVTAFSFDDDYDVVAQEDFVGCSALTNYEILGVTTNPWDPPSPVRLYVAHSQLYAQGGIPFTQHAPYPGMISVLEGPDFDTPVPLITGLPTSNHDHAVNGIVFDNNGDLLISIGSNTNGGVTWPEMGGMDEGPLTAAVLKAETSNPSFNGTITYEETLSGLPNDDQGDSAIVDVAPGVDVAIHASGVRNALDLLYTTDARLYLADNGPNSTFGPASTGPTTDTGSDAVGPDEFLHVERGLYYGSANRNRGRTTGGQNVQYGTGSPGIPGEFKQTIQVLSSSANGLDEYRATTFQSQMRDEILVQRWNGVTNRIELSDDGRSVEALTSILPTTSALGLRTGPGGAAILMDFSTHSIKTLEPQDVSATGMVAWDVFPWRAVATGGTPFVIGGKNFGPMGTTAVFFDGIPATITSVTAGRIHGTIPPAGTVSADFVDIIVDSGGSQSVIPDAFRYLFVPAGNEPGRWEDLPAMPVGLGEVAAAEIDGVIYVVGEGNDDTHAYDVAARSWSIVAQRPFPGHHSASEVVGGKWYLFGGIGGGSPGKVQIYDPDLNTWGAGTDMPWAASSSASCLLGGKVYLAGGMVNGAFTVGTTVAYDPGLDTYTTLASMPLPRNHAAAATDGEKLWVFGGRGPGSGDANVVANGFDDVLVFDPNDGPAGTWETNTDPGSLLLPLPIARGGMGKAVFKDGEFYVFGGETLNGPGATVDDVYDRVDVYDPVDNTWRAEAPMPLPRHGVFPVLFEGRIFLPGGGTVSGFSQSTGTDVFDRQ